MKITLIGAAGGEVTGSAYVVQTRRARVLVDAGMFQGGKQSEVKNRLPSGAKPSQIDAVLLTHAHLDHTGRVPLLIKHGYTGPIYATQATLDLAEIILKDAAKIQLQDAERANRKRDRSGKEPVEPLFGPEHVEPFRELARPVDFRRPVQLAEGIVAHWVEAGHMLGSGSIELSVEEDGRRKVVVFSGDLGPKSLPIVREFDLLQEADLVFLESTYGNREHRSYSETVAEFEEIVKQVSRNNGKMLVPTFAIGRSQQILYHLAILFRQKKIKPFPVYLDSPMAIQASRVFVKHPELFDEELAEWRRKGLLPLDPNYFKACASVDDSRRLNRVTGPCAILAGAGMCNAGRILHHLKENLWRSESHVLIVGYQGYGSLGRRLVDGEKFVGVLGERIAVRAQVHTLNGFSAHAGQGDLLRWFEALTPSKPRVILTHGEDPARETMARLIRQRFNLACELPGLADAIEL
jgi:metallo-beta-lactamase family protein